MAPDPVSEARARAARRRAAGRYEWPRLTVIHPEYGSCRFDVHCLRSADDAMVLLAFGGGVPAARQVSMVRKTARHLGDTVVDLAEDDISHEMGVRLAAEFHADPGADVVLLQVEAAR